MTFPMLKAAIQHSPVSPVTPSSKNQAGEVLGNITASSAPSAKIPRFSVPLPLDLQHPVRQTDGELGNIQDSLNNIQESLDEIESKMQKSSQSHFFIHLGLGAMLAGLYVITLKFCL